MDPNPDPGGPKTCGSATLIISSAGIWGSKEGPAWVESGPGKHGGLFAELRRIRMAERRGPPYYVHCTLDSALTMW